jgi:hypothetical protein
MVQGFYVMTFEWASVSVAIEKINVRTSMYPEIFDAQVLDGKST